ncbi:MAG: hypothetical protein E2O40_07620 [Planctomycetota bacterium]|nr:MAG: hypothetical protein E2O40_07620 [Planctomycetota bacterium]
MKIRVRTGAALRRFSVFASCSLALILPAVPAQAGIILEPGSYLLGDHPDGDELPPSYGLRLDELVNVTSGHDVFTFSFDHALADMRLDITAVGVDAYEIRIHGTAFGGLVVDNQYDATMSGVVDIDFVYMLAHPADGDDDLIVTTRNFTNTGSITFEGVPINLSDRANSDGFTFRLGDENDDQGHRGFDGISGFGWLDHGTAGNHVVSSDWLFTVIPTPGSAALLSVAFAILSHSARRR